MYQRIFVPVDGSETSNLGLAEAIQLAKLTGGRLQLLHVIDEMQFTFGGEGFGAMYGDIMRIMKEAGQVLLGDARALAEQSGVPVETMLLDSLSGRLGDHVATQVAAWGADLIVLGDSRAPRRPTPGSRQRRRADRAQRSDPGVAGAKPRRGASDASAGIAMIQGNLRRDARRCTMRPCQPVERSRTSRFRCGQQVWLRCGWCVGAARRRLLAVSQSHVIRATNSPC
jgi:nucleotide-binding universal stress UspA family protein